MKHLRKYNESRKSFDVEFFNSVFAEFLDQEDVECEHLDGTYWEIFIPIPDIRRIGMTKKSKDRSIKDYVEVASKIDNIMKDIEVAMNRVKDEYGDSIITVMSEEDEEYKWLLHILYENIEK